MNDTKRAVLRVVCSLALVLGSLLVLAETRSTGEALESLKVMLLPGPVSTIGAGIVALSVMGFVALHFWELKATPRHP